jgi:hypothetical protein
MPFDPNLPAANSPNSSAQMRAQLTGLKDLIDAVSGVTSAQVDAVNTLPPGTPATVAVSVSGTVLHFTFELPQGNDGGQGEPGSSGSDGGPGPPGQNGEPFTNFVVDGVTTLNPGDNATVNANFDGTAVRLSFGIPRGDNGDAGPPGSEGAPGEVSNSDLQAAINGSSANSNGVSTLSFGANPSYDPAQQQEIIAKINELISALRR